MKLRALELKDAELMLEWMHDYSVVRYMHNNFIDKTIADCEHFIKDANKIDNSIHMAIVDDYDEYMGTVSLKNILEKKAEFAIAIRNVAMGKGYSQYGMKAILEKGFIELGLEEVYWCVSPDNSRAIRFYEKNGYSFVRSKLIKEGLEYNNDEKSFYRWYKITFEDYFKKLC